MGLLSFCQWLNQTPFSAWLREAPYPFPILIVIHVIAIALFGGMVVMGNLRVLGWAMRGVPGIADDQAISGWEMGRLRDSANFGIADRGLRPAGILQQHHVVDFVDGARFGGGKRGYFSLRNLPHGRRMGRCGRHPAERTEMGRNFARDLDRA